MSRTSCLPESPESSVSDGLKDEALKKNFNSNETVLHNVKSNRDSKNQSSHNVILQRDSSLISKQLEHLNVSNGESPVEKVKGKSPEGEEVPDHKFLAPDFNILRVQREEISDSESLASNDTADTLDDNQIECLLLDKVLPLDVESDIENSYNCK